MNHWHGNSGCNNIECPSYRRKDPLGIETKDDVLIVRMSPEQAESIAWACKMHSRLGWREYGEWAYDLEQAVEKIDPEGRPGITLMVVRR